jgi:hypothetical protein
MTKRGDLVEAREFIYVHGTEVVNPCVVVHEAQCPE